MALMPDQTSEIFMDPLFRDSKKRVVEAPRLAAPVADTHCHLDMLDHPGLALARCAAHDVRFVATVVDSSEDPGATYDMLAQWIGDAFGFLDSWGANSLLPTVRVIAGCHPHNAVKFDSDTIAKTQRCLAHPLTVALGEIGLDYHYDLSPREVQKDVFRRQLAMAHEADKPVVLHIREAHDDALAILDAQGIPRKGAIVHCFTSDAETVAPFVQRGCHVAFGGALTFNDADQIREAAAQVPLDLLLTETDAPYMAPKPLRGTVCTPACVVFTARRLAEVRGIDEAGRQAFLGALYGNALRFYGVGEEQG